MGSCYESDKKNCCNYDCQVDSIAECDKYKAKSDELYVKAHCIQEESKRFLCESKELEEHARDLERKAKQLCAQAKVSWDNARKLECESNNLLDLASFYAQKASECYKNMNNSGDCRPICNSGCCTTKCSCTSSCTHC